MQNHTQKTSLYISEVIDRNSRELQSSISSFANWIDDVESPRKDSREQDAATAIRSRSKSGRLLEICKKLESYRNTASTSTENSVQNNKIKMAVESIWNVDTNSPELGFVSSSEYIIHNLKNNYELPAQERIVKQGNPPQPQSGKNCSPTLGSTNKGPSKYGRDKKGLLGKYCLEEFQAKRQSGLNEQSCQGSESSLLSVKSKSTERMSVKNNVKSPSGQIKRNRSRTNSSSGNESGSCSAVEVSLSSRSEAKAKSKKRSHEIISPQEQFKHKHEKKDGPSSVIGHDDFIVQEKRSCEGNSEDESIGFSFQLVEEAMVSNKSRRNSSRNNDQLSSGRNSTIMMHERGDPANMALAFPRNIIRRRSSLTF